LAAVTLEAVRKVYPGGVEAIPGLSLAIEDGSFTVLLGPSGCGKSTLLRMIAGLETITTGTCKIGNRVVNDVEPAERDIAMVFQNYALYPHMTVYANMAYGLKNRGTPNDEIKRRVGEAAKMLDIEPYLDRKPRALSGGQRQRVAMGRAIVREPQAFLFDEPLSNLDAKLRGTMRLEIRRLHNRLKATSIFVTHDQIEAMTLADKVVVMNKGRIEQVGRPVDVYHRPATKFVATFIGSPPMNMLPGKVTAPGTVDVAGGTLSFNASQFRVADGSPVDVGIRGEGLVIAAEGGLTFVAEFVEELGPTRLVHGTAGGIGVDILLPTSQSMPSSAVSVVPVDLDAVHLFDANTGVSLRRLD
jgi:sn-glycerol 3-phosphate transport system ATP-binding protein